MSTVVCMGGESGDGERATTSGDEAASGVLLRNAASFGRGHSNAGCGCSSEGVLLVRGAGAGREDAVRLAGCEGSVSLAWRAGVG